MLINHASKQVTAKIVYYGTGLGGKTTNLQYIFSVTNPKSRGELISMETEIERTLFFDLLPINVGLIKGYQTRFQLYTVPGQVFYDSTRKLVLRGADGIVFVADSQELMAGANQESFENLRTNLGFYKLDIESMPMVLQYNKRDLKNITPVARMNEQLNRLGRPYFEAVAKGGKGVIETLREISSQTLQKISQTLDLAQSAQSPLVDFDTDAHRPLVKPQDIPLKKIVVERPEELQGSPISLTDETPAVPAAAAVPPAKASAAVQPSPAAKTAVPKETPKTGDSRLDFFNRFEDTSRLTRIEKIIVKNSPITLEIRDAQGEVLKSLSLEVHPDTKKINLILDVKK